MEAILSLLRPMTSLLTFVPLQGAAYHDYADALRRRGIEVVIPPQRSFARFMRTRRDLYDLVIFSRYEVATEWLAVVRRYQPHAVTVFDTVDLYSLRFQRHRDLMGAEAAPDPDQTREIEGRLMLSTDITAAVTEVEARAISQVAPGVRTVVLPNVHEVRTSSPPAFTTRRGLLFIGSFLHPPNVDAVAWFAQEILPRIRSTVDVDLLVVGADPPAELVAAAGPHVRFEGWVPAVEPLFDAARVFVAPLRWGAGMKGKVGQAMALGLPVVTTSIGAEGMDLADGVDVLIRDEAGAFADAVLQLHEDRLIWERLSTSALNTVAARWSSGAMQERLRTLLDTTTNLPGPAAEVLAS
jgi:glycosyltransferase involved in cell wall biosynthesis